MLATDKIRHSVEEKTGDLIVDLRSFAGGNNTSLYLVDLQGGERMVAKVADSSGSRLDLEGWMLSYLKDNSDLPVPDVIWAEPDMLIMSYHPSAGALDAGAEEHAAGLISSLHTIESVAYGLERDTLIGPLDQPNNQEQDWITFFRDHRLMYMARAALDDNRIDGKLMDDITKLASNLDRFIDSPARPSLLHGDLWGGNVLAVSGKITAFIDPAIYYGDPEMDLAFSTLFGTFGENFFQRYNEISPIRDGFFEARRDLYNLYPLLVHVRLFGKSYIEAVKKIVNHLVV